MSWIRSSNAITVSVTTARDSTAQVGIANPPGNFSVVTGEGCSSVIGNDRCASSMNCRPRSYTGRPAAAASAAIRLMNLMGWSKPICVPTPDEGPNEPALIMRSGRDSIWYPHESQYLYSAGLAAPHLRQTIGRFKSCPQNPQKLADSRMSPPHWGHFILE